MVHFVKGTVFLGVPHFWRTSSDCAVASSSWMLQDQALLIDWVLLGGISTIFELIWQKYSSLLPQDEESEVNQLGTFAWAVCFSKFLQDKGLLHLVPMDFPIDFPVWYFPIFPVTSCNFQCQFFEDYPHAPRDFSGSQGTWAKGARSSSRGLYDRLQILEKWFDSVKGW